MRKGSSIRFLGVALGLGVLVPLTSASADVVPAAEGTIRFVCSDEDGSKHPKRATIEQVVSQTAPPGAEATALILDYDSTQEGEPKAGVVQARVELEHDGETRRLASFKTKTDPEDGHAAHAVAVAEVLEPGDLLRWRLKFKKFRPLLEDKCFVLLASSSALPPEEQARFEDPQ